MLVNSGRKDATKLIDLIEDQQGSERNSNVPAVEEPQDAMDIDEKGNDEKEKVDSAADTDEY